MFIKMAVAECPDYFLHHPKYQQDSVDRSANHRPANLIGSSFQQAASRNSPNHQEDDVDLEALVNDMNSSFESLYSAGSVQCEAAPLLHNGQHTHAHSQPISLHQRLRRSQPMHILAVRRLQEEEFRTSSLPAIPNPFPELCSPASSPTACPGSLPPCQASDKHIVKIFGEDGMGKVVEIPSDMTARDLCQLLVYKSHCVDDNSWALVEHHPALGLERCLEDHELVVQVQASMTSESKFVFRKNYAKYEFFKNPLNFFPEQMVAWCQESNGTIPPSQLLQQLSRNPGLSVCERDGQEVVEKAVRVFETLGIVLLGERNVKVEDSAPEEDENEENPFATEFQEDQEAAYLKDPKKALQGFYDREGEELEFEYDDKGHGTWLCRIKLPVDDAMGKQLVAEVTHSGRKKEAAVLCCLEACRMLEARGLLRQEAVSRKRKKKNWEEDDYYDSDDDSFLDRTGTVERKRKERMKKAGKIQERPETYDSLVAKLAEVEKELAKTEKTLTSSEKGGSSSATEDPLDAFMSGVRSQAAVDVVQRKKLHLQVAELKKEAQRLQKLIDLTRPTQLPSLQSQPGNQSEPDKPKKLTLPLFGAMKGGRKFKLKTGAIGKLPPKRPNLPPELFNMKELPPEGEEEEEEEDEQGEKTSEMDKECNDEEKESTAASEGDMEPAQADETEHVGVSSAGKRTEETCSKSTKGKDQPPLKKSGKMIGPSRPPSAVSKQYPEDDPDYCVWVPPAGQTGDGRTHLNDKYGY